MILFGIETQTFGDYVHSSLKYRWYSKYNGARGAWCRNRDDAESGGNEHHKIILALHGKDEIDNSTQQPQCNISENSGISFTESANVA
jgi:hypothetical protein